MKNEKMQNTDLAFRERERKKNKGKGDLLSHKDSCFKKSLLKL